nr:hypothetical protein [Tanacetum cinerariifolium]
MSPGIHFYNCEKGPPKFSLWRQFAAIFQQHHHLLSPPQLTTTSSHHHHHHSTRPPPLDTSRVIQVNSSRSSQLSRAERKYEKAFYTSLKKFIDDCKLLVDSAGNIRCPCKSCRLVLWVSIKHLADHISKYGFDPSYKTWIHHGEADLSQPPPVIDNTKQPQMSDMTA